MNKIDTAARYVIFKPFEIVNRWRSRREFERQTKINNAADAAAARYWATHAH